MTALEKPNAYRQSLLAKFDACPRSALFSLLDPRRSPSLLAARGTLFHRFVHQAVEIMRQEEETTFSVEQGIELLAEVLCQADVPAEDVVPLTMREMRWLRVLVVKWCAKMELSVDRIVSIERRLFAEIPLPVGGTRQISGQLDILMAGRLPDEALVLDYKTGYARPKQPRDPDGDNAGEKGLTELGWVQSLIYAVLVFSNFPVIQRTTFREYHVFWGETREVTIERWEAERMIDVLAAQVALLDRAIEEGIKSPRWTESAGPHCAMCSMPRYCPIKNVMGIPTSREEAQRYAQEWIKAGAVRNERLPLLKGWVEKHGPIEVPHAHGRRMVGWDVTEGRKLFGVFEPRWIPGSPLDSRLIDALHDRKLLIEEDRNAA